MNYTVIEKNGRLWKRMPNGSLLIHLEKQEKISAVYCLLDLITGKKYIGSTCDYIKRAKQHLKPRKYVGVYLKIADINYTVIGIIERVEAKNLLEREAYWIAQLNTIYPNGYNLKNPITKKLYNKTSKKYNKVKPNKTKATFKRTEKHSVWYNAKYKKK